MEDKLPVNRVIPFSNVDGEGNRLSVFVQGCNLNCIYCHNPETLKLCNNCGLCVAECSTGALSLDKEGIVVYNKKKCIDCGNCIGICPNQSSPKVKWYSINDLLNIIDKYGNYIRGITVSGGEPVLYGSFLTRLFPLVKDLRPSLSCFVDTNGFFSLEENLELISATDGFLFDMKAWDKQQEVCGFASVQPRTNLEYLLSVNKVAEVRTVILAERGDMEQTVVNTARMLASSPEVPYRLIRVHYKGVETRRKELIESLTPDDDFLRKLKLLAIREGAGKIIISG